MPFDPNLAKGYAPSIEEILEDLEIDSPDKFKETIFNRCEDLSKKSEIKKFNRENFIVCDSKEFYPTLVNMGYGNSALTIMDDYSSKKYFLIFKDKIPKKFHEIVARHESSEYIKVRNGMDQRSAHREASSIELNMARHLGKFEEYINFLKENYPMKLEELETL